MRSVRLELLDRTINWNERQLRALLEEYTCGRLIKEYRNAA